MLALIQELAATRWTNGKDQDFTAIIGVSAKDMIQYFGDSNRSYHMQNKSTHTETTKIYEPDKTTAHILTMKLLEQQNENGKSRQNSQWRKFLFYSFKKKVFTLNVIDVYISYSYITLALLDWKTENVSLEPCYETSRTDDKIPGNTILEMKDKAAFTSNVGNADSNREFKPHGHESTSTYPCDPSSIPKGKI
jgi:hypothetical protein